MSERITGGFYVQQKIKNVGDPDADDRRSSDRIYGLTAFFAVQRESRYRLGRDFYRDIQSLWLRGDIRQRNPFCDRRIDFRNQNAETAIPQEADFSQCAHADHHLCPVAVPRGRRDRQ